VGNPKEELSAVETEREREVDADVLIRSLGLVFRGSKGSGEWEDGVESKITYSVESSTSFIYTSQLQVLVTQSDLEKRQRRGKGKVSSVPPSLRRSEGHRDAPCGTSGTPLGSG